MTQPGDSKVTVRVQVEGGTGGPVKTTVEVTPPAAPGGFTPFLIVSPKPATANTSVFNYGGNRCIEATGTSPKLMGALPQAVYALAFCDPNVTPSQFPTPPTGAVRTTCLSDGSWSFTAAKGIPVPGACCDGTPGGANNSTIIVWYDFGGSPPTYSTDYTPFHGLCMGSGSGVTKGGPKVIVVGSHLVPVQLHGEFAGALSALRTVRFTWNGVSWVGESRHCGGAVLSLQFRGSTFQLQGYGPATTFIVADEPRAFEPFHWSARGQAFGQLAGEFIVTLVE